MYLPRSLLSKLYLHLQNTRHPLSPPVLILAALEPDALCACRILTRLLKHDYIPHKIQPVAGYADLERVGRELVSPMMETRGGAGGIVVCLGVGGMVDLGTVLGLEPEGGEDSDSYAGVEVWVVDSHRPWNLANVFGGFPLEPAADPSATLQSRLPAGIAAGRIERAYKPGKGGIVVLDDGDVEDGLETERAAYMKLAEMPEIDDDGEDLGESDSESEAEDDSGEASAGAGQKRKSWSDHDEDEDSEDDDRPRQRRRSNSSTPIPDSPRRPGQRGLVSLRDDALFSSSDPLDPPTAAQPPKTVSARTLRRRLLRLRRENETILRSYYRMGTSYAEPISSMMYSLASELGREDNDLLWLTIVGVTSMELYGRSSAGVAVATRSSDARQASGWLGMRGARIRQLLRDEVRRLNPPDIGAGRRQEAAGIIPTTARSPEDTSIRLSPEPKFLLIRHWSLYDSMLHSPYLFSRLKTWSEVGLKRLHKLLAKMGVSLVQCKQSYTHMDMVLKRELRTKLLKYASMYDLDELVPTIDSDGKDRAGAKDGWGFVRSWGWRATLSAQDVGVVIGALLEVGKLAAAADGAVSRGDALSSQEVLDPNEEHLLMQTEEWIPRFWDAYDALEDIECLKAGLPTAQFLHKSIFTTGTTLLKKKQITHLRAFRMCIVKDSPDVSLFNHPGALTKLALWIGEALAEQEKDTTGKLAHGGRGTPLVVASLSEKRGVYIVVGTGGGGGPDAAFRDQEARKKKQADKDAKAKLREQRRQAKLDIRAEKRAAKRAGQDGNAEDEDQEEEEDDDESESDGSSDSDSDSDEEDEDASQRRGYGLNRFGTAFQDVVAETNARIRIDSFEHCVVEVKKEDLGGFLEALSMKAVVG